jgi:hypothetical protein
MITSSRIPDDDAGEHLAFWKCMRKSSVGRNGMLGALKRAKMPALRRLVTLLNCNAERGIA